MTTHKPELMPDEIWTIHEGYAYSDDGTCFYTGNKINPDDVSYTRTDLYTAACAERDALRELCEGMAGALSAFLEECQFGGMPPTGKSITAAEDAIIEYLKHKAGE